MGLRDLFRRAPKEDDEEVKLNARDREIREWMERLANLVEQGEAQRVAQVMSERRQRHREAIPPPALWWSAIIAMQPAVSFEILCDELHALSRAYPAHGDRARFYELRLRAARGDDESELRRLIATIEDCGLNEDERQAYVEIRLSIQPMSTRFHRKGPPSAGAIPSARRLPQDPSDR